MDVFTDASLNDAQKIAGIGMVFVPNPGQASSAIRLKTHVWADKIETAELFAVAIALDKLHPNNQEKIRIVMDSKKAMTIIMNVFQYYSADKIDQIKDLLQRRILYSIAASFERMKDVSFAFCLTKGHQSRAPLFSDGYYNNLADEEAELGRIEGEDIKLNEMRFGNTSAGLPTAEENALLNQRQATISSPNVSFVLEINKPKNAVSKPRETKGFVRKSSVRAVHPGRPGRR